MGRHKKEVVAQQEATPSNFEGVDIPVSTTMPKFSVGMSVTVDNTNKQIVFYKIDGKVEDIDMGVDVSVQVAPLEDGSMDAAFTALKKSILNKIKLAQQNKDEL